MCICICVYNHIYIILFPDGVGTNGVVAEVPQFHLMNLHGEMLAKCDKLLQHVVKRGKIWQNAATRAHLNNMLQKCTEVMALLRSRLVIIVIMMCLLLLIITIIIIILIMEVRLCTPFVPTPSGSRRAPAAEIRDVASNIPDIRLTYIPNQFDKASKPAHTK